MALGIAYGSQKKVTARNRSHGDKVCPAPGFPRVASVTFPRSAPTARRDRGALLPTVVVLVSLLAIFALFTTFYTELLWFRTVDASVVFTRTLTARAALFIAFGGVLGLAVALNAWIAWRSRPPFAPPTPDQVALQRYREQLEMYRRPFLVLVPAVLGTLSGVSAAGEWRTVLLFLNRTPFGSVDPQFGLDISYFTFVYPFQRLILSFLFAVVTLSIIVSVVLHYLYGAIRLQTTGERVSRSAQVHLSVLIGIFLLLKAGAYWLDRYGLALREDPLITGLKYRDVNAQLPALSILTGVAVVVAILFFISTFREGLTLPVIGVGLMFVTSILIGGLYPAFVQQVQVRPTEIDRETPYIQRNINATRDAYGLSNVQVTEYAALGDGGSTALEDDAGTLRNIRLLDPTVVATTFEQLQEIRNFYSFPDVLDVDRYDLDGERRGVVLALRELSLAGLAPAQRNWANQHVIYTHGFGIVAAFDNTARGDGRPEWLTRDLPPVGDLDVAQPRIYFGERSPVYSIVGAPEGTTPIELDYPDDSAPTGQRSNTYDGAGGVSIGSYFHRLLFAVKYQEINILLSDLINEESKILFNRPPRERVEKVAPWLRLDGDPYPAVIEGRIVWILDGYTTSANYPYSTRTTFGDATLDSTAANAAAIALQARDRINYIRNSVKATVDAYDGTVTLYAWGEQDPMLQTWAKTFPGTVTPASEISDELAAHLRYPEDLFKVQRDVFTRYHVTDPRVFYSGEDFWETPDDPTQQGRAIAQPPYYLSVRMPDQEAPVFSLTTTFAPRQRLTLAAFMAVSSQPGEDYGTIRVLRLPRSTTVPGPVQAQNQFESDATVAAQLSLLRRGGSDVNLGNLLSLPIGGGILYVEPVYVRAAQDGFPLLRRVLVSFGQRVAFEDTLERALQVVFEGAPASPVIDPENPAATPTPAPTPTPTPPPVDPGDTDNASADLARAIRDAQTAYDEGRAALSRGDFAAYGQAQERLLNALRRAESARARLESDGA
jgi:uncharacterized protein